MKIKLPILIIGLCFCSQLFAQPARWENSTDELIHKLQQLSSKAPDLDRQILTTLQNQGFGFISPEEIRELEHLLRQDVPSEILKRQLRRLPAMDYLSGNETGQKLINSVPIISANANPLTVAEHNTITQALEDFQVNENVGRCDHYDPAVAMDGSGNFVITWLDNRNGKSTTHAQRFRSNGVKDGPNFGITDDDLNIPRDHKAIAMDASGNFVKLWIGEGGVQGNIYGQRYDREGKKQGLSFRIDEDYVYYYGVAIAMDGSGNFVIVWCGRDRGVKVFAQRFDRNGNKIGENIRVSDKGWAIYCSIAMDEKGNFVVVWVDEGPVYQIYAQRYSSDGSRQGDIFLVNDNTRINNQCDPAISLDGSGNFMIAWMDGRNGNWDIYAQRYDGNGNKQGVNFRVNDDAGTSTQYQSAITVDGSGNFVIIWTDGRNGNWDIYAQRYDGNGNKQGVNFRVNDDVGSSTQYQSAITVDGSGNFVITWTDRRNGIWDIYAQRYEKSGNKQGVNFRVNDDEGSSYQINAALAVHESGNFVVAWQDYRYGQYSDIFAQRFNSSGARQGINFRVNDHSGSVSQGLPAIAMDGSGNFIIAWEDRRNGKYDIYAQRYNSNGNRLGANFMVNDAEGSSYAYHPAVAADGSGNFVITWDDWRNGNRDIYAQRYDGNGNRQGVNFRVNDDTGSSSQSQPAVTVDGGGNFVIAWEDRRNGINYADIYAQCYDGNGNQQGVNFRVNDNQSNVYLERPKIAADRIGNFVITWQDDLNDNKNIYAQRYHKDRSKQGINFRVNDDTGSNHCLYPSIGVDNNGNFVIAWQDYRSGNADIYAQRYDNFGNAIDVNYRVNNDTGIKLQRKPDVKLLNNHIYYAWEDNRIEGQGWDIFARVDLFDIAQKTRTVNVAAGWNIISVPLKAADMSVTALFPGAASNAFQFNNGYVPVTTLSNGVGYWIKFNNAQQYQIHGHEVTPRQMPVNAGWNIIGPFEENVPIAQITSEPPSIIQSDFFKFDNGYKSVTVLEVGKGYWVKVSQSGMLRVQQNIGLGKSTVVDNQTDISHEIMDKLPSIRFEESNGHIRTLYLTSNHDNSERSELPPIPPTGIFDVRFSTDRLVENLNEDELEVLISSAQFPVKLTAQNLGGVILNVRDGIGGLVVNQSLTQENEIVILRSIDKIFITSVDPLVLPSQYQLSQNYPNPFNPTSVINYALPEAGQVRISVYNILGKKVADLVDQAQPAGYHQVDIDALNYASGIYYYVMKAKGFSAVKKMAIVK